MEIEALIASLETRGIRLIPSGADRLLATPSTLLSDADREAIRANKPAILRALTAKRPARIVADSRNPLVSPTVRAKIEAIEPEARRLGWPGELLWSAGFWDAPRGLAAVLDDGDLIVEVTEAAIEILKLKRDRQVFMRRNA